jgi:hypothetical protein
MDLDGTEPSRIEKRVTTYGCDNAVSFSPRRHSGNQGRELDRRIMREECEYASSAILQIRAERGR